MAVSIATRGASARPLEEIASLTQDHGADAPEQRDATCDILAVDDNSANLLAIEATLGGFGGSVVRAQSGQEALRLLLRQDFALILLDVRMPTMDGFETARLIRGRERSKHTPIIFVTGHDSDDEDVLAAYALGAVDFLAKPIVPAILKAKVSVFVELQRRASEVARQAHLIRAHEQRDYDRALAEERARWEAEALRRQMEQLAESDRRKDEFLAVLSHELRNPLAPLVTGLELLRERLSSYPQVDAPVLKIREAMERQVQHLSRLVDDLLDISRISSGKIELRKAEVGIRDVIEQALATSQPLIDAGGHALTLEVPDEPLVVHGDPVRLVQVIANLLNNAVRFTQRGGEISVRVARAADAIEIHVKDNGHGIAPDVLSRVFDMFVQETPRGGAGLGLGLAVVRGIVSMHGGSVTAFSAGRDLGSEFVVRLPLQRDGTEPVAVRPTPASYDRVRAGRSLSIVLVEDSDDISELVSGLLRHWGHSVHTASEGATGIDLVLRQKPDVALIDIGLPEFDGYEVAARIRAASGDEHLRLVAVTGFGQPSDRCRALEAGFDAHLVKPVSSEALRQALEPDGE